MERKLLLNGNKSKLSVVYDSLTDSCSIAIVDGGFPEIKYISKKLYNMLCEELENQEQK